MGSYRHWISTGWISTGRILTALSTLALPAWPCACVGVNAGGCQAPPADVIVLATVLSKEVDAPAAPAAPAGSMNRRPAGAAPAPLPQVRITLNVSERFRGDAGQTLVLQSDTSDCAVPFETGQEYLVFARNFQGSLTTTTCSGTRPAKGAATTILQLRALRDGTTLPDLFGFAGAHPPGSVSGGWDRVQPVPGLTVTARSGRTAYRTKTGDDGSWAFERLPAGRYQISIRTPPGRLALWNRSSDHAVAGVNRGMTSCPVNFEIFNDGRISGDIDAGGGEPASGYVFAWYEGAGNEGVAPAGSQVNQGHFEIDRLWPGPYRLVFMPASPPRAGLIYYPGTQDASKATPIEVGDGTHVDGLRFQAF